jgi:hypothetical protein
LAMRYQKHGQTPNAAPLVRLDPNPGSFDLDF